MITKKEDIKHENPFARLTWEDLAKWAGSTIVDKGRKYKQYGYVRDLSITSINGLIAWVHGTERYATVVEIRDGKLISNCSCPYGGTCKHAVAVVLEYLDCLKNKKTLPKANQDDKRLLVLKEENNDWEEDDSDWDDWDVEDYENDVENNEEEENEEELETTAKKNDESSLHSYLEKQTKEQLIKLLEQMASQHFAVKQTLEDMMNVKTGKANKIMQAIRNELAYIEPEPRWGYRSGNGPDWDRIKAQLLALLQSGHADEVLDIGEEILENGNNAIETYDEEGEVGQEVSSCIKIVFEALPKCSLSLAKQLQWITKMVSEDEYSLCDYGVEAFWQTERTKSEWNELANELQRSLNKQDKGAKAEESFSYGYRRDNFTNRLITAFEKAERTKEIIPLCEREAIITGNYERLVDFLIKDERWKDAEEWCRKGIEAKGDRAGINSKLRNMLYVINEQTGNYLVAAALSAEEFFASPRKETFKNLCKSAKKAGVESSVEAWARNYLETGEEPQPIINKSTKQKKIAGFVWPLPSTKLKNSLKERQQTFPVIYTLIDIAIDEKKPEEVLKWFDSPLLNKQQRNYYGNPAREVAEAVKDKFPDRAIAIWKRLAEEQIALTDVKAYAIAGEYLRKVKDVLISGKREIEWQDYLTKLRLENKRKIRCVQILDGLAGKPIIDC
jgi:uncharacterized Zn finger protein